MCSFNNYICNIKTKIATYFQNLHEENIFFKGGLFYLLHCLSLMKHGDFKRRLILRQYYFQLSSGNAHLYCLHLGQITPYLSAYLCQQHFFFCNCSVTQSWRSWEKKHFLTYNFQRNQATILSVCIAHDNFKQKGTHNSLVHCEDTEYANKRIYE